MVTMELTYAITVRVYGFKPEDAQLISDNISELFEVPEPVIHLQSIEITSAKELEDDEIVN